MEPTSLSLMSMTVLSAVLTLLLSQLTYAVALVRTWKVPDRAGLALAMAAGATQVFITFFADLRHTTLRLDPWPWLSASLGIAALVFAGLAWRPIFSRKGDVGLLIGLRRLHGTRANSPCRYRAHAPSMTSLRLF
jgi:hypothetical protein